MNKLEKLFAENPEKLRKRMDFIVLYLFRMEGDDGGEVDVIKNKLNRILEYIKDHPEEQVITSFKKELRQMRKQIKNRTNKSGKFKVMCKQYLELLRINDHIQWMTKKGSFDFTQKPKKLY
jgi:hypothetical protein